MLIFKSKKTNKFSSLGFTLIETITVVAIVSVISVVMLANYNSSQKRQTLQRAVHQLAGDVRRAQNMAMASTKQGAIIPYGYGIYIHRVQSSTSYILFADNNDNKKRDAGLDIDVETISFSSGIEIANASLPDPINIFFEPPDPTTYISGESDVGKEAQIILTAQGISATKSINVKTSGQIEIE
jgi:prepilin-type N-terminal cleavage/methylation domain-containing protein